MGEVLRSFPKDWFLELIASGRTEPEALIEIGYQRPTYVQLLVKDVDFRELVEQAKKDRADVWHSDIIKSVDETLFKDDVPAAKLKFEQRKYLAAIDNPDKYAEKSKNTLDVTLNIFQEMKDLPTAEAKRILKAADPFAVDAEFSEVPETPDSPILEDDNDTSFDEDIFS